MNLKLVLRESFLYGVIQLLNLIIPFLVFPFILKKIGSEAYGQIIIAQSISALIALFGDLGLNIIGVRELNRQKGNQKEIITIIYCIRTFIFLMSLLILISYRFIYEGFISNYLLCFIGLIAFELFFPRWIYQSETRAKKILYYTFLGKVVAITLILITLKETNPIVVPVSYSIGFFVSIFLSLGGIKNSFTSIKGVKRDRVINLLRVSLTVFFPKTLEKVIENSFNLIAGFGTSASLAVTSELINKSLRLLNTPSTIIINSTFPLLSRDYSSRHLRKILIITPTISFFAALIYFLNWDIVLKIFAIEEEFINNQILILSIIPALVSINWLIGDNFMIIKNKLKEYNISMMIRFLSYFLGLLIFYISWKENLLWIFLLFGISILLDTLYKLYVYLKD